MKNKKFTYILIPLVLVLWGTIVYRIFHTVNNNNSTTLMDKDSSVSTIQGQIVPDTFSIHPDYNDPFQRQKAKNPNSSKIHIQAVTNHSQEQQNTKQAINQIVALTWPNIIYNGLVKNQKSNKQLAILQVNGQSNIMQVGDIIADVKLVKITTDSVELVFQNTKKAIKK